MLQGYSVDYLINDKIDSWVFKWRNDQVLLRKNKDIRIKADFFENKPIGIDVRPIRPFQKFYHVSLIYDELNQIKEKVILEKGKIIANAKLYYDSSGRRIVEELNLHKDSKKYVTYYSYYNTTKLEQLIGPGQTSD